MLLLGGGAKGKVRADRGSAIIDSVKQGNGFIPFVFE